MMRLIALPSDLSVRQPVPRFRQLLAGRSHGKEQVDGAEKSSSAQRNLRGGEVGDDKLVQFKFTQDAGPFQSETLCPTPQGDPITQGFGQQGGVRFQQQRGQGKIAAGQVGGGFAKWTFRERIEAENLR
jgi:hypothetical protein